MSNAAQMLEAETAQIVACTVSRDVSNFDLLIEDMEAELGESWGDLGFDETLRFLDQPDASALQFIAIALDEEDESDVPTVSAIVARAKERGIRVLLIVEALGPAALHQLMKLGANDFLPYPLPQNALHEAIERLSAEAVAPAPAAPQPAEPDDGARAPAFRSGNSRDGVILPVHGLAGGVGASTFAVNLAWEIATLSKENGPRVCLLDFDLQMGAAATYLDLPRRDVVFDMLSDTSKLDTESLMLSMVTYNERLHVLTAPGEMLPLDIVTSEDIHRILNVARSCFDFVIVDMPSTVVQWTEAVLNQAHVYFAEIELDMRSAQNTLRMIRALKAEDLPLEKMRYVLNRAPGMADLPGKARVKRLAESLDIKIELQMPDGGRQVTQANDHGLPLALHGATKKNALRKEIGKLAKSLFELNRAAESAKL
ncbi:AAA family ATPase [Frigidibacter sp. MR17.24]|uniref:AAA family ATPase n=1 Tax=Frigidibacter sp. MR17.24 TaxID=3127345 RepID=UPI003012F5BF